MSSGYALGLGLLATLTSACGSAPLPAEPERTAAPQPAGRARSVSDDCAPEVGKPPPAPLERQYEGLAKAARCQREVYTIMGGVTHFLGVKCTYCHLVPDYRAMTHRKRVANWMARELVPRLAEKAGGEVWCNDCHQRSGRGTAKILGNPRDERFAIEFMTTHLVENLETSKGQPLRCKMCHGANLGSPGFRRKIILTDHLPPR
ncbi:MAG TPA: hypothetical protein VI072_34185 [Polyangiaceae bacterium]